MNIAEMKKNVMEASGEKFEEEIGGGGEKIELEGGGGEKINEDFLIYQQSLKKMEEAEEKNQQIEKQEIKLPILENASNGISTTQTAIIQHNNNGFYSNLERMYKLAEMLSKSTIIPRDFQGKPANVFIALDICQNTGLGPLVVMQNLYVILGSPTWKSSFLIARANTSGLLKTRIKFERFGKIEDRSFGVIASAILKNDEKISFTVDLKMADAEGWTTKNGNKYRSMPELMLMYRSAAFLIRVYLPETTAGLVTKEEIEDMKGISA